MMLPGQASLWEKLAVRCLLPIIQRFARMKRPWSKYVEADNPTMPTISQALPEQEQDSPYFPASHSAIARLEKSVAVLRRHSSCLRIAFPSIA
jgi:hypothetical protein